MTKTWNVFFSTPKSVLIDSGMYVVADNYEAAMLQAYESARAWFAKSYDGNHLDVVRNYNPARVGAEGLSRWSGIYAFDPITQEHELAHVEKDLFGKEARALHNLWSTRLPHQLVYIAQLTIDEAFKQGLKL